MSADIPPVRRVLAAGWELAVSPPGACADPAAAAELTWSPAMAGAAGGLTAAGAGGGGDGRDYDAEDWWFRVRVDEPAPIGGEELRLALGGLATVAEVYVDDALALRSESMFAAHEVALEDGIGELVICCRALAPLLAERRRPRARWRTRLVVPNLRFWRTMLLGRAPGFAPGPAVVGPWRPVVIERRHGTVADDVSLRPRLDGADGVLAAAGRLRSLGDDALPDAVALSAGEASTTLSVGPDGSFAGELRVPGVALWWPHTHGAPVLHTVSLSVSGQTLYDRRVGFRSLQAAADLQADGPALAVNGVPVFCRGAVWTPWSLSDPDPGRDVLAPLLAQVADAGLNMLRIPGTGCWESAAFHDLCDELGILVWQDCMFANLDYPESDEAFMATVRDEVSAQLAALAARPSLAVVCGGSEVAQQVAMVGLDPSLADGPLYGELLPSLVAAVGIDAPYVASAPWGGTLPFRPDRGVANYYGVGAYLRPLEDARRAEVRFASECLAFANVGDGTTPGDGSVLGPAWKAAVPRDVGAGWDFDDVRDHYLAALYGLDPVALRYADPDRYLALSRQCSGEVMAETFAEWRREASPCRGALVLWLKDLVDGAGWGLIDSGGRAKVALHHLRRALAPLAVWTTDEGLSGIAVHLANDGPEPFTGRLRVALYRDGAVRVEEGSAAVTLAPHGSATHDAEAVLGHFADVSWAYRFGPPPGDLFVASLHDAEGALRSQSFRFPAGRPLEVRAAADLGLYALVRRAGPGRAALTVAAERLAFGVRVDVPGWRCEDDAFSLEPGHPRELALSAAGSDDAELGGRVTALNVRGAVTIGMRD